jgi:hypothetical protein
MATIALTEVQELLTEIFNEEDAKVASVDTVFEKIEGGYKLVITLHQLSLGETMLIHTKFVFKTDTQKSVIIDNSFIYLYDINCVYHHVEFDDKSDLKNKIKDILQSNDFGKDIRLLSDFIEAPAMFLNFYMKKNDITDYSVFNVVYEPKFKTISCDKITFDFDININNNYTVKLSIKKNEPEKEEDSATYKFHFSLLDSNKTIETDTLKNVHFTIGSEVADMLDQKLK